MCHDVIMSADVHIFKKKFSPNLLNGLICEARTPAKQSLLRRSYYLCLYSPIGNLQVAGKNVRQEVQKRHSTHSPCHLTTPSSIEPIFFTSCFDHGPMDRALFHRTAEFGNSVPRDHWLG